MFRLASLFVEISGKADPLNQELKKVQGSLNTTSSVFSKIARMGGAGIASGVNVLSSAVKKLQGTSLGGVSRDISLVAGAVGMLGGGSFAKNALNIGVLAGAFSKLSGGGGGGGGGAHGATKSISELIDVFSRMGSSVGGAIQGVFGLASSFLGVGGSMAGTVSKILAVVGAFSSLIALIPYVGPALGIVTGILAAVGSAITYVISRVSAFGESFLKFAGVLIGNVVNGIMQVISGLAKLASALVGGIISGVESLAGALGRLVQPLIKPALIGIAAGIAALGYGINKATNAASALHESMSKIGVVFAEETATVMALVNKLADSFGLPRRAMVDAAAMFGMISTGAGASQKEAAKFSTSMTQLAADSMSFMNVPLDVALEKIRAGLVGESEPLHAWGVTLSEEAVKLEGVRLGLAKTGKELDQFAKITARASLITKGLAPAVGDLDRTFGDTENQVRRLSGNIDNTLEVVGAAFLRLKTQIVQLSSGTVDKFREAFVKNRPAIDSFLEGVSERLTRFHEFMVSVFGSTSLGDFAASAARGFMQFGASLEVALMRGPELLRLFGDAFMNAVGPLATSAMDALGIKFDGFSATAENALAAVELGLRNLPEYAEIAGLMIQEKFQQASTIFFFVRDTAMEAATSLYTSFSNAVTSVTDAFRVAWAEISTLTSTVFGGIVGSVSGMMNAMTSGVVGPAIGVIGAAFTGLGKMIVGVFGTIFSPIMSIVNALGAKIGEAWTKMADEFDKAMNKIKNAKMPELPNKDAEIQFLQDMVDLNEEILEIERERAATMRANQGFADMILQATSATGAAAIKVAQATGAAVEKAIHPHTYGISEWAKENVAKQLAGIGGAAKAGDPTATMTAFNKQQEAPGMAALDKMLKELVGSALSGNTLSREMERSSGRDLKGLSPEKLEKAGIKDDSVMTLQEQLKALGEIAKGQAAQTEILRFGLVVGMK